MMDEHLDHVKSQVRLKLKKDYLIQMAAKVSGVVIDDPQAAYDHLIDRWVGSEYTDFGIYQDPLYIEDMVHCFVNYSRTAAYTAYKVLRDAKRASSVETVLDYYNGVGLSTILLAWLFPKATVYYFNDNPKQEQYLRDYADVARIDLSNVRAWDNEVCELVFVSEVFEHYPEPRKQFDILEPYIEQWLCYNSLFRYMSAGHFPTYEGIPNTEYINHFNRYIKSKGFHLLGTGWNSWPFVYERA